jgi:organic radical activating enzyme
MLPIVEIFTSIQGEGKYVGHPSIFIRVTGCNLKCCFGDSVCDTYYTSYYNDEPRYTKEDIIDYIIEHQNINHIVITGGEPLLYAKELENLIWDIRDLRPRVTITIETNGTIPPLHSSNIYYSVSPKLSTAVAKPNQTVILPGGKKHTFTQTEIDRFNNIRINKENLSKFAEMRDSYQFKFVYTSPESIDEIKSIIGSLSVHVDPKDIYLMPEGDVEGKLLKKRQECVEACIENGWTYTDRIHILIWGDKREV